MYNPFSFSPPNIDQLSLKRVPPKSKVLDLGCAEGKLGQYMEKNLGCKVVGVEKDPIKAKVAISKINKMIIGDIENSTIIKKILKEGKYDLIFASAILEHLKEPHEILKSLLPALSPKGSLIVTFPNICHWTIRLKILIGKFNYTKSGILDRTHLHFYTPQIAREFFRKANLKIIEEDYELMGFFPLERLRKIPFLEKYINSLLLMYPGLFAYQILIKAKPKNNKA